MEHEEQIECNMCGELMDYLDEEGVYACFNSSCTRCYEEDF